MVKNVEKDADRDYEPGRRKEETDNRIIVALLGRDGPGLNRRGDGVHPGLLWIEDLLNIAAHGMRIFWLLI